MFLPHLLCLLSGLTSLCGILPKDLSHLCGLSQDLRLAQESGPSLGKDASLSGKHVFGVFEVLPKTPKTSKPNF